MPASAPVRFLEFEDDGKHPFSDWLMGLKDERAKGRVLARLRRFQLGNHGDVRPVGGGVSELRIHHGPGYRVYFGTDGDSLVVLLGGSDKRRQQREIRKSQARWLEYKYEKRSRSKDENT